MSSFGRSTPALRTSQAQGRLAFELVGDPDHGALRDIRVRGEDFFDGTGREPVPGDIDDVVGASHDEDIALLVDVSGIGREVVARERSEIGVVEALVGVPERRGGARRHRQLGHERTCLASGQLGPVTPEHPEIPSRYGSGRRPRDHGKTLDAEAVRGDRPARFRLPPVVDHRDAQLLLRPTERLWIAALPREEECAEVDQVVAVDVLPFRILLADGAESCRGGEERADPVVRDHPPEGARIGCADRLSLVEHGRASVKERRIDDVRVADDPAHVRRGPVHLSRRDVVDVLHRPLERDGVAAVVPHDPLRLAGRA